MLAIRPPAPQLGLLLSILLCIIGCSSEQPTTRQVRIAIHPTPLSASLLLAEHEGGFAAKGLEVTWLHGASGEECMQMLIDGEADLATATTLPVVYQIEKGEEPVIYASIARMHDWLQVVARPSTGIETIDDLPGHRVATVPRTNTIYFFDNLLHLNDLEPTAIEEVPLSSHEILEHLSEGRVDAAALWPELVFRLRASWREDVVALHEADAYYGNWNLVGRRTEDPERQRMIVRDLLRTIMPYDQASIRADPQRLAALAELSGWQQPLVESALDKLWLAPRLDQSLLLQMEDQHDWLSGRDRPQLMLEYLDPQPIHDIDPLRTTIQ